MPTKTPKKKAPAKRTASKSSPRSKTRKPAAGKASPAAARNMAIDDNDFLLAGGAAQGAAFGRCGGRAIQTRLERDVCDQLTGSGVAHSHRPRHFEVRFENDELAAFAPCIVLRGRGREGKTVVIETCEEMKDPSMRKVRAFREQYGSEFYLCLVAPEEVLDDIHFATYDEAATSNAIHTLVSRLTD